MSLKSCTEFAATSSLAQSLIDALGNPQFLERHWDRAHWHARGCAAQTQPVLSIADIDHLLTRAELRWPYVRLYQRGQEVPREQYTYEADLGAGQEILTRPDAILQAYAKGATLSLLSIESYHLPVASLCSALLDALADRVERIHTNAYLTPRSAQGFNYHWDTHDVVVIQLAGAKHWRIYGSPISLPSPRQVCGPHQALIDAHVANHAPAFDAELQAGDVLYLPRGAIHAARTTDHHSLHLTLGLTVRTRLRRLDEAVAAVLAQCAHQPRFQQALPLRLSTAAFNPDRNAWQEACNNFAAQIINSAEAATI